MPRSTYYFLLLGLLLLTLGLALLIPLFKGEAPLSEEGLTFVEAAAAKTAARREKDAL